MAKISGIITDTLDNWHPGNLADVQVPPSDSSAGDAITDSGVDAEASTDDASDGANH